MRRAPAVRGGPGAGAAAGAGPGDVFLDLEGDSFAREGGREYLFGVVTIDEAGAPVYRGFWAFTDAEERAAFEAVIDLIVSAWQAHDGMHVYHYAPYEPSAFKRLMGRYATREEELDRLLRGGRFVDLYGVVRQGLRAGVERYSIKNLEPFYGFERDGAPARREPGPARHGAGARVELPGARSRRRGRGTPSRATTRTTACRRSGCATGSRRWRAGAGGLGHGARAARRSKRARRPRSVDERAQRVEALRARLLDGVPRSARERSDEQQARWLLAYLLDWHRREDKAVWWEYFRLRELPEEDLFDEPRGARRPGVRRARRRRHQRQDREADGVGHRSLSLSRPRRWRSGRATS